MSPENIHTLLSHVKKLWPAQPSGPENAIEIALEANPSDYDEPKWQAYNQAGINRLSLGVQSFDDDILKRLGRNHDANMANAALQGARDIFGSLSLDLIFGVSNQSLSILSHDLDTALSYALDHISTYQLTIEDGTAFDKALKRGENQAVSPETSAAYFEYITQRLTKQGFEHYEVSNFAKPAHRARHNLNYWQGGDYVGVGPGAHGRLTLKTKRFATIAPMTPDNYINAHRSGSPDIQNTTELSPLEWAEEYLLMGLRINEGISLSRYAALSGHDLPENILQDFINQGMLAIKEGRLSATQSGRLVLDYLTQKLLGA